MVALREIDVAEQILKLGFGHGEECVDAFPRDRAVISHEVKAFADYFGTTPGAIISGLAQTHAGSIDACVAGRSRIQEETKEIRRRALVIPAGDGAVVVSVNVGQPRTVEWRGRRVTSAIWKEPVDGSVTVEGENLAGDDQADRRVHGGADKAVYAYAVEDYDWWATSIGPLSPGTFGENLTTAGIDLNGANIGDHWRVGSAVLEIAQPRQPCFKLGIRMGDDNFPGTFEAARRPGAYLRIIGAGVIAAGDAIRVEPTEQPAISIGSLVFDDIELDVLRRAVEDPRVPDGWRHAAARALSRS